MKEHSRIAARAVCLGLAVLTLGCSQQQPINATRDGEAAIRDTDMAWSKATANKQAEEMVAYYSEDGSVFAPGAPAATGKEALRNTWAQLFNTPGFSLSWETAKVEVARSGDLGYSNGTYQMTVNDPQGNPIRDEGKYLVVWKKQTDGTWKAAADMFNSSLPPPAPPAK